MTVVQTPMPDQFPDAAAGWAAQLDQATARATEWAVTMQAKVQAEELRMAGQRLELEKRAHQLQLEA